MTHTPANFSARSLLKDTGKQMPTPAYLLTLCGLQWGLSPTALTQANTGAIVPFTADAGRNWTQHTISMTGLKPATEYHYRVGDPATSWSETFRFRSQDDATTIAASLPQVRYARVRSRCRFRKRGAGSISESGFTRVSGRAARRCDRTLAASLPQVHFDAFWSFRDRSPGKDWRFPSTSEF